MLIPRHWSKALGSAGDPEGKHFALKIWGWSQDSVAEAAALARRRLAEASSRIARGALPSEAYFYGKTPLREEIVRAVDGASPDALAVVTRNRYGALVLNAARVPFIDVDVPASFRARLTPKPWRCGCSVPPASYPFDSPAAERACAEWLRTYESAIRSKATCELVESVGPGRTLPEAAAIVSEHDRTCRVGERLPLA